MPSTEPSSSAWYSPEPACSAAGSRIESRTAKAAVRIAISEIEIARSSSRSAPETRSVGSSHCQISSPAVAASVEQRQRRARRACSGLKTPLSRTTQSPTVSAMTGESAGVVDVGGVEVLIGLLVGSAGSPSRSQPRSRPAVARCGARRSTAADASAARDGVGPLQDQLRVEGQAEDAEHQRRPGRGRRASRSHARRARRACGCASCAGRGAARSRRDIATPVIATKAKTIFESKRPLRM